MKNTTSIFFALAFIFLFTACNTDKAPIRPKHIILVGFDGLSSEAINKGADMPNLRKLMHEGSYTLENRSVLPSSSAVNWASMFMGACPELHGYTTWGSQKPELPSKVLNANNIFPTIFSQYRLAAPEAEIGFFYEWGGMKYLADTLVMNTQLQTSVGEQYPDGAATPAVNYIKDKKPNFCAIIFDQPDGIGHGKGWCSPEYMKKLQELDGFLGQIIQAVDDAGMREESVIMVVSDHGGIGTGHGGKTMSEMETPIVFAGKGIKAGFKFPESTMVYDIAGTIAYMLDVPQPQVWVARPILSIFSEQ